MKNVIIGTEQCELSTEKKKYQEVWQHWPDQSRIEDMMLQSAGNREQRRDFSGGNEIVKTRLSSYNLHLRQETMVYQTQPAAYFGK